MVGQTIRTLEFTTSTSIQNATLYLITSNHGANAGGEEYVRRNHYIYFDETLIDAYKPGVYLVNLSENIIHNQMAFMVAQQDPIPNGHHGVIGVPMILFQLEFMT
ncbi:MAG: hypothetical protein H6613_09780 [Ignavibacteriales bacterium]|nr:hypothetical protein [Ignavibacteriales bacterium]